MITETRRQRAGSAAWGTERVASTLAYEIRERSEPGAQELGVLAGGLVFRWKVPADLWSSEGGVLHLIQELQPRSRLLLPASPPWDAGGCLVDEDEALSASRFRSALREGRLRLRLRDGRASGTYHLERLRSRSERWKGWRLAEPLSSRP